MPRYDKQYKSRVSKRRHSGLRLGCFMLVCIVILYTLSINIMYGNPFVLPTGSRHLWQETAASKREEITSKIPRDLVLTAHVIDEAQTKRQVIGDYFDHLLDADTVRITEMDRVAIVDAIAAKQLSATKVVKAFCKRAVYAHQISKTLLDFDCNLALATAAELDEYQRQHGKLVGPLHGLPVSLKDQFHVKGMETTMGYVGWVGTFEGKTGTGLEKSFESELVRKLRSLGAVPFAKGLPSLTFIPDYIGSELVGWRDKQQLLGYLWNPLNRELTAGGSSGGEGALGAFRGSAFGLGTDSGGSVSMPAAYNGLFSLKPSSGRLPFKGVPTSSPGQDIIRTVPGIVASSIRSLALVMKSVSSAKSWLSDNTVFDMPWKDSVYLDLLGGAKPPRLSIGLFENDGIVTPHPPIVRALSVVADALRAADHEIFAWNPPSHARSSEIHPTIARGDGMPDVVENVRLSGEPFVPQIKKMFPGGEAQPSIPLVEFADATVALKSFRSDYHDYWQSTAAKTSTGRPVDALIFPAGPHTAPLPNTSYWYTYTSVLNVLDYCAVVILVTTANATIDVVDKSYKPMNEKDELNYQAYNPKVFDGAPAGVVIVGRQLQEEKLLAVANIIYDALQAHKA